MVYGSVWSKDGQQHLEAASCTSSSTRNHPAGAVQSAGEHAITCTATELPTGFWGAGKILFHLPSLHSPSDHL